MDKTVDGVFLGYFEGGDGVGGGLLVNNKNKKTIWIICSNSISTSSTKILQIHSCYLLVRFH